MFISYHNIDVMPISETHFTDKRYLKLPKYTVYDKNHPALEFPWRNHYNNKNQYSKQWKKQLKTPILGRAYMLAIRQKQTTSSSRLLCH
jgi:hypothetical protein